MGDEFMTKKRRTYYRFGRNNRHLSVMEYMAATQRIRLKFAQKKRTGRTPIRTGSDSPENSREESQEAINIITQEKKQCKTI